MPARVCQVPAADLQTERYRREIAELSYDPSRGVSVIVWLVACAALALSESCVAWSSRELSSNRNVATRRRAVTCRLCRAKR